MQIELRRFTTNARLSQETTAFAADVWIDGTKVGYTENDGHGGCTMVRLNKDVLAQVEAHGKTLVPAEFASFTGGAEWIIDQLVEAELQKRHDKAFAKRLARVDTKEKTRYAQRGLRAARLRIGDAWLWFGIAPSADAKAAANAIAAKRKGIVDELVML